MTVTNVTLSGMLLGPKKSAQFSDCLVFFSYPIWTQNALKWAFFHFLCVLLVGVSFGTNTTVECRALPAESCMCVCFPCFRATKRGVYSSSCT